MRKVLRNSKEVAHFWANKIQDEGRVNNMFFEGPEIYSYGRHFLIAKYVADKIVFLTERKYSSTTAKHVGQVRHAIPHDVEIIRVPDLQDYSTLNIKRYCKNIEENLSLAGRAKSAYKIAGYISEAINCQHNLTRYIDVLGIETDNDIEKYLSMAIENNSDVLTELREREKLARSKELEKKKEEINNWINGGNNWLGYKIDKCFLRLNGEIIETSKGAEVPVKEGKLLFMALAAGKNVHGLKVGNYTTIGYVNDVLTIGCHKIEKDEICRFANLMGWQSNFCK